MRVTPGFHHRLRRLRQLDCAGRGDWSRWRRDDRADVPVRGLVEVDDHWGVVAWTLALAHLAVYPGGADAGGGRGAGQDQVDPHSEVSVEHPGPVVPVGEDPLVRPAVADDVAQAEC